MQIPGQPRVEIVVPVKNEENDLGPNIRRLREFLDTAFPFAAEVCIADNGSTDATYEIGMLLAAELPGVRIVRLEQSGRGRALKQVWSASTAEVLAYMDVDLSTNLNALLPLVAPLLAGHSDVAIGTRLSNGSRVVRRPKREFISRSYNLLLRATLNAHFSDAQCGFKAIRAEVARELLPLVQDTSWFFDTELLVLAEKAGLRIHEVPVDWVDDLDSRVAIAKTVGEDLRGIARLMRDLGQIGPGRTDLEPIRQAYGRPRILDPRTAFAARVLRFCAVGVLSTAAYALLYLVLRQGMPAQLANVLSLLITAVGNTALNRRITFGVRGLDNRWKHQLRGLVAFGIGWSLTGASLWLLHTAVAAPQQAVEITVLTIANLAATVVRFSLFQTWVFDDDAPTLPAFEPPAVLDQTRSN
jgi:putative flippase GtrA/glycosyltransferase involved in cell wall biosynthesis